MTSDTGDALRDPARLAALRRLALLDTPSEAAFDRLTRLAATTLRAPVALVSLVAEDRQFFKSCVGLPEPWQSARETPLSHSFCQHTIASRAPLIIADARDHPLVHENLAIPDLNVIAYAGIPLVTADGQTLGSFCVIAHRPRRWTADEIAILTDLAAMVMTEIELRATRETLERRVAERTEEVRISNKWLASELAARQRADAAVRASEEQFRAVFAAASIGMALVDAGGALLRTNRAFQEMLGHTEAELVGVAPLTFTHPDDAEASERLFAELVAGGRESYQLEKRYYRKDGRPLWVNLTVSAVRDAEGRFLHSVSMVEDVTERRRAEERLRASEAGLAEAQRLAHLGSWEWDVATGEVRWSDELYRLVGAAPRAFTPSREVFLQTVHPDDRVRVESAVRGGLAGERPYEFDYRVVRPDGGERILHARAEVRRDAACDPRLVVGTVQDITERIAIEARLQHQATHDPLTGLPNRALFLDRLQRALAPRNRPTGDVAVLFLDLDRFKVVNDSLGHEAGDRLLVAVVERLLGCVRRHDLVARFGGDEFMVLLRRVSEVCKATDLAERVLAALAAPLVLDGREFVVGASVGVVVHTPDGEPATNLLHDVDIAMYQAKAAGRGRYAVFDPQMNAAALARLELEADLRGAPERGELRAHYQPLVDLATGRVVAFEALVRWAHPARGLVPPADFIPLAEETGLIRRIGRWILEEACRQVGTWREQYCGGPAPVVCVNLSAAEFRHPALADDLAALLGACGLPPGCLELEITESVAMADAPATVVTLRRLKALGVRLALDDFGTGYSSLAYLKRFPVDVLKIDRAFVAGLGRDPEDTALVGAMVTLGHTLGLRVVAEGVETADHAAHLAALGCDLGQGYHFAKPLPPDEAGALLGEGGTGGRVAGGGRGAGIANLLHG